MTKIYSIKGFLGRIYLFTEGEFFELVYKPTLTWRNVFRRQKHSLFGRVTDTLMNDETFLWLIRRRSTRIVRGLPDEVKEQIYDECK